MFEPVRATSVHRSIVGQLLGLVQTGRFQPGERLPSERLLAEMLGVSRSSVREALRVLEHPGAVQGRQGYGWLIVSRTAAHSHSKQGVSG